MSVITIGWVGGQAKVGGTSTRIVHKLVGRVQEL